MKAVVAQFTGVFALGIIFGVGEDAGSPVPGTDLNNE